MDIKRPISALLVLLCSACVFAQDDKRSSLPSFDYEVAVTHEIKPHRRTIPEKGVEPGFNQLSVILTVSPAGEVIDAKVSSGTGSEKYWPLVEGEVRQWKFTPFEEDGKAATAEVQEYVDLVPPERLPIVHVAAPVVRADSIVEIVLERSGCFGSCPSYKVTVSTNGIVFEGSGYVTASGKHNDTVNPDEVRDLARLIFIRWTQSI
jgi:hypothetical protein